MIILDTTVLVYAVGLDHRLREPCRRVLAAHARGDIEAMTTFEVIQEFAHVRARRRSRTDATFLARRYATALALLAIDGDDLELGLTLFERYPALGAFDAILAAVALNRQVDALISADGAFGAVAGLRVIDPASAALDALLDEREG